MASVPIAVLLYNGPVLCDFNVPVKGLTFIVHSLYTFCLTNYNHDLDAYFRNKSHTHNSALQWYYNGASDSSFFIIEIGTLIFYIVLYWY